MELTKRNLAVFITKNNLDFNDLEDIDASMSMIEEEFNLIWGIGIRSTRDGSDFWLECDYYSKKIRKTIVFDTDFQDSFKNIREFTETILQYNEDIKNFETNLKYNK